MSIGAISLHFKGDDFILSADDLDPRLAADLRACGGPGDAGPAVQHVRATYIITGDPGDCAAYLDGYGAWESDELLDHNENLARLVWIAGGDLLEQNEIYFCNY